MSRVSLDTLRAKTAGVETSAIYPVRGSAKVLSVVRYSVGTPSSMKSLNVASLVDIATGRLGINLTANFADIYYASVVGSIVDSNNDMSDQLTNKAVNTFEARHIESSTLLTDPFEVSCTPIGDLA